MPRTMLEEAVIQLTDRRSDLHAGDVLTAVVRARCVEAFAASALARHGGDDLAQLTAGVRS